MSMSNNLSRLLLTCATISTFSCTVQQPVQHRMNRIQLPTHEVQPVQVNLVTNGQGKRALRMAFTYSGSHAVGVLPEYLPWHPVRMKFYATFSTNDHRSLVTPFWNFSGDMYFGKQTTLEPGDRRTNQVDLEEILPGVEETLQTNDMVLFWIYAPPPRLDLVPFPPSGTIAIRGKSKIE